MKTKAAQFVKRYWPAFILAGVGIYLISEKIKKNKIYKALMLELDVPTKQYGNIKDATKTALSETYNKTVPSAKKLTQASAEGLVVKLRKALTGVLGDDEDEVYRIFSIVNSKVQMSQLAEVYKQKYNQSLFDKINSDFNDEEKKKLQEIILSKPDATY